TRHTRCPAGAAPPPPPSPPPPPQAVSPADTRSTARTIPQHHWLFWCMLSPLPSWSARSVASALLPVCWATRVPGVSQPRVEVAGCVVSCPTLACRVDRMAPHTPRAPVMHDKPPGCAAGLPPRTTVARDAATLWHRAWHDVRTRCADRAEPPAPRGAAPSG